MRLLFVVNNRASFVARRLALAEAAAAAGYDVHAVLPTPAPPTPGLFEDLDPASTEAALAASPVTVHPVPLSRRGTHPLDELGTLRALGDRLRALRPRLVHQFTMKPILYGTLAAGARPPFAIVNSFVGLGYLLEGTGRSAQWRRTALLRYYGWLARRTGAWSVFQNPDNLAAVRTGAALDPARVALIRGSGVDLTRYAHAPLPDDAAPLVVLPARMLVDKGLREFHAAAALLRAEGVPARFALVGGTDPGNPAGVTRETLEAWVATGAVEWWGHQGDMPAVLRAASVVCLPSYAEGVPRALLEAAAVGRPIVTCDVPGCREVVQPGVNGLLVPPRDAASLADALRYILLNAPTRAAMAAAGRRLAEEDFSLEGVVRQTLAVYSRAVAG
jgi:glycosyltransferase involved in cell wall biosynthesis